MLSFEENLLLESFSFKNDKFLFEEKTGGDIPKASEISGIELRIVKAEIFDNRTRPIFPFPGLANVYLFNLVVSDIGETSQELNLEGFQGVDDNSILDVNRSIFYWKKTAQTKKIPSQIHVLSSIIKSKGKLRKTGEVLESLKNDEDYKSLISDIISVIQDSSPIGVIISLLQKSAPIIGKFLKGVEDKPIFTRIQSFTDLGGDFDVLGQTDHPASNRGGSINLRLFVRDKKREIVVAKL